MDINMVLLKKSLCFRHMNYLWNGFYF